MIHLFHFFHFIETSDALL